MSLENNIQKLILNDELSRIGIGTYKMTVENTEHYRACVYSLKNGCNLIDTSSNYMQGKSEILVGKVLHDFPEFSPCVISKVGYMDHSDIKSLQGEAFLETVHLSENFKHSIHPDFISKQLNQSLERIQKDSLGAYLIHNPEYYFKGNDVNKSKDEFYARIKKAFEFLEQKVHEGKISYYGISSNTLPFSTEGFDTVNLNSILKIVDGISSKSSFKFIQFPVNLLEESATLEHHENRSVISIAHANNLKVLSNRPFNANYNGKAFRLLKYNVDYELINKADSIFNQCIDQINQELAKSTSQKSALDFPAISFLVDNWQKWGGEPKVKAIFSEHIFPFLQTVHGENISSQHQSKYLELYQLCIQKARQNQSNQSSRVLADLFEKGTLKQNSSKSLSEIICEKYLEWGVDSVLVGMRQEKYVDELKHLFINKSN